MTRHLRNGTVIECVESGSRVILPDGTVIFGTPHDTDSYRRTARELGYGDDVLAMTQDHDALHAITCDALGLSDSPVLRVAAGLDAPSEVSALEERAVLSLQEFCRKAGVKLWMER